MTDVPPPQQDDDNAQPAPAAEEVVPPAAPVTIGPVWPAWAMVALASVIGFWLFGIVLTNLISYGLRGDTSFFLTWSIPFVAIAALFGWGAVRAGRGEAGGWQLLVVVSRVLAVLLILIGLFAGGCGILVVTDGGTYSAAGWAIGIIPGVVALALATGLWMWTRPRG